MATKAIDNITIAHTAYLNARPLRESRVTPNKRYDSALIPYKLLTKYPGKQVTTHFTITLSLLPIYPLPPSFPYKLISNYPGKQVTTHINTSHSLLLLCSLPPSFPCKLLTMYPVKRVTKCIY